MFNIVKCALGKVVVESFYCKDFVTYYDAQLMCNYLNKINKEESKFKVVGVTYKLKKY